MALLPVPDALARVLDGVEPLPTERVPLAEAEGRVLAEDLTHAAPSRRTMSPPWTAMRCTARTWPWRPPA